MRDLTPQECAMISGAADSKGKFTVSPETAGSAVGGFIGDTFGGGVGALGGTIAGGAIGNYLTGDRKIGSVGSTGIPWGATNGGGSLWGPTQGA